MPVVSFTHTEINPSHSEGSGGGRRSSAVTEQNPTYGVGSGGGRRVFAETEIIPTHVEGAGGGRRVFVHEEMPPNLGLPLPEVATEPATEVGLAGATINGFLEDGGGLVCVCRFEWGLTESYGRVTAVQTKTTGERFSQALLGLEADTVYHFKAIASNVFGVSYGVDKVFKTLAPTLPPYFQTPLISLLEEDLP